MRSKRITTIHDLTPLRFSDPTANPIVYKFRQVAFRWLVKHVAKKSAVVLTGSEYTKTDIAQFASVSPSKIRVIPHAADHIEAQAQPIPNLGDSPFVFYVGRAQSHKNLERLIEAFTLLADSNPELKLVLAGKQDGNYGRLETIAGQSPVSDKIIFTGFISDAELKWLYENARAYVFPSLSEGFGLPGLEAMVHGCPVVSSNATCLPEVYGNAAVYFGPTSPEEMAKAIESVITDEGLRKSLIEKGYRQAGKYSWQKTAEQTLEVYCKVLGR
jgi:glycosyltransferase involved in cell wall biosynthesis